MKIMLKTCIFILVFISCISSAQAFSLWDVFPDNQGDNNMYVYAYNGSSYRQLNDSGSYSFNTPGLNYTVPLAGRSTDPWIYTHPGGLEIEYPIEDLVLAWKVPAGGSGLYNITGEVKIAGGGIMQFYIKKNADYVFEKAPIGFVFNEEVTLAAGDFLYFGIAPGTDGRSYNGTTTFKADVDPNPVPLPPSLLFLAPGFLGLMGFKRKYLE
jgi:hypothetical protein